MIKIYFDTLPTCAPCQAAKPAIRAAAAATGSEFIERNDRNTHGVNTVTVPTIYIKKDDQPPVTLTSTPTGTELIQIINSMKDGEPTDTPDTAPTINKKMVFVAIGILILMIIIFYNRKSLKLNIKM